MPSPLHHAAEKTRSPHFLAVKASLLAEQQDDSCDWDFDGMQGDDEFGDDGLSFS